MMRPNQAQEPTLISRIEQALDAKDDFMTSRMIAAATGIHSSTVRSILITMRKLYQAFDCVEQDKDIWWFRTPETDKRIKHVDMRVPEAPGNRGGRSKRTLKKMEAKAS